MFPIAASFSAGVRVEVIEPEPAVAAEEPEADELSEPEADELSEPEADELSEPEADELSEPEADELSLEAAAVVVVAVVVVVDDELSPLLSLAVCEAVSQAARKKVAAKSAIRR